MTGNGGRPRDPAIAERLFLTAVDVIAQQGLHRLTITGLCARARAGKEAFGRRWPSVDHFLADLAHWLANEQVFSERRHQGVTSEALLRCAGGPVRHVISGYDRRAPGT